MHTYIYRNPQTHRTAILTIPAGFCSKLFHLFGGYTILFYAVPYHTITITIPIVLLLLLYITITMPYYRKYYVIPYYMSMLYYTKCYYTILITLGSYVYAIDI